MEKTGIKSVVLEIKQRYGSGLADSISQQIHKVSSSLNTQFSSYDTKINALRNLISEGGVNIDFAHTLNKSLVKELTDLRSSGDGQFLNAPITIRSLDESQADELTLDLIQNLRYKQSEFFYYFEQKMLEVFYLPGSSHGLIQFHKHNNSDGSVFSQDNMDYLDLVESYIENYANLINGKSISWDKKLIMQYIKFLENNIYIDSTDIENRIKEIVVHVICSPVLRARGSVFDLNQVEDIEFYIKEIINNLVKERTSDFDELITEYKFKFVNSINTLFEQFNLEQFPAAISDYMEIKRNEDGQFFEDVLSQVQLISDKRANLEEDLASEGLLSFAAYPLVEPTLAELNYSEDKSYKANITKEKAREIFSELFSMSNCILSQFMAARNEYSNMLDGLLNLQEGEYANLINQTREFKFNEDDIKNKVNLAVINSLESLALQLKSTYISTLSCKYREFYTGDSFIDIRAAFQKNNAEIHSKSKDLVIQATQKESHRLLDVLANTQTDSLAILLDDKIIKSKIFGWLTDNSKNEKWKKYGIWKPDFVEVNELIEEMFLSSTETFLIKKTEFIKNEMEKVEESSVLLNIAKKVCNISKDGLKVLAAIKTFGATLPLLFESESKEVEECSSTIESMFKEIEYKLKGKELEETKEQLLSKVKESPEALSEFLDLLEKTKGIKINIARKVLTKLNQRYNPLENEKQFTDSLLAAIVKIRNNLDLEIQKELIAMVQQRKQEMQSLLNQEDYADAILNEII